MALNALASLVAPRTRSKRKLSWSNADFTAAPLVLQPRLRYAEPQIVTRGSKYKYLSGVIEVTVHRDRSGRLYYIFGEHHSQTPCPQPGSVAIADLIEREIGRMNRLGQRVDFFTEVGYVPRAASLRFDDFFAQGDEADGLDTLPDLARRFRGCFLGDRDACPVSPPARVHAVDVRDQRITLLDGSKLPGSLSLVYDMRMYWYPNTELTLPVTELRKFASFCLDAIRQYRDLDLPNILHWIRSTKAVKQLEALHDRELARRTLNWFVNEIDQARSSLPDESQLKQFSEKWNDLVPRIVALLPSPVLRNAKVRVGVAPAGFSNEDTVIHKSLALQMLRWISRALDMDCATMDLYAFARMCRCVENGSHGVLYHAGNAHSAVMRKAMGELLGADLVFHSVAANRYEDAVCIDVSDMPQPLFAPVSSANSANSVGP